MSGFKTFDDGTIVTPAAASAHGDWHIPPVTEKPSEAPVEEAPAKGVLGKLKKKKGKKGAHAEDGDGKAGIPGAVFNLANAVRVRRGEARARWRRGAKWGRPAPRRPRPRCNRPPAPRPCPPPTCRSSAPASAACRTR